MQTWSIVYYIKVSPFPPPPPPPFINLYLLKAVVFFLRFIKVPTYSLPEGRFFALQYDRLLRKCGRAD